MTTPRSTETYALARPYLLHLERLSRLTDMHPDLLRRFVALGLLEVSRDARGELWFEPSQVRAVARIQRLHWGLNLDYAAIGLVCDLLDRIAVLEAAQRRAPTQGDQQWT